MQHEVSKFIVVAPANMGKSIQWAEPQLRSFLEGHFPLYRFRIWPCGPFAEDDRFSIIPIMNRPPAPGEQKDPGQMFMASLDPTVIPEIQHVLRSFDPTNPKVH